MTFAPSFERTFRPPFWQSAAAAAWWLGGGTIAAANVLEYVELPTQGQAYAGASVEDDQPWTIAASTSWNGEAGGQYVFDSSTPRIILGISGASERGFYCGSWTNIDSFVNSSTNYHYLLISTGTAISLYRNGELYLGPVSVSRGFGQFGATRWRSDYLGTGAAWVRAVPRAAVYNVALDATQRAGLYASMVA